MRAASGRAVLPGDGRLGSLQEAQGVGRVAEGNAEAAPCQHARQRVVDLNGVARGPVQLVTEAHQRGRTGVFVLAALAKRATHALRLRHFLSAPQKLLFQRCKPLARVTQRLLRQHLLPLSRALLDCRHARSAHVPARSSTSTAPQARR